MSQESLAAFVEAKANECGIPGVAVGVWVDGREVFACHGVTNLENPLPVTPDTLFRLGSVTKTYTATALMRLVEAGQVELDAPVRRYVPEFALPDEEAAARITVRNLLNHTAGLDVRTAVDTGDGDDALAAHVAQLAEIPLIAPVGARASYSQLGYNLAGRIVEKVTGLTYERAAASLLFEPLGMTHSFFAGDEVMTRRFAVGHNAGEDGTLAVARRWKDSRANNPGGGIVSSVADQLRWARFHLGDGCSQSGARVMSAETLHRMAEPTVVLRSSSMGDAVGIGWFLRHVDGVRTVGHGGSANGQFAELLMVPERGFAVAVASNAGPDSGPACNQAIVRWALEHYLGVADRDPEPLPYDPARIREFAGSYEIDIMTLTISADEAGPELAVQIKPELRASAGTELPPDLPPADFGLLPGGADDYIVTSGGLTGQRGFFTRDETGRVVGVDLAGRLFRRVHTA